MSLRLKSFRRLIDHFKKNARDAQSDDSGAETLNNVLPIELLLKIFRLLDHDDLISAEQVCKQWKNAVETCFATQKLFEISFSPDSRILPAQPSAGLFRRLKKWLGSSSKDIPWIWMDKVSDLPTTEAALEQMRRYGHSVQTLALHCDENALVSRFNWAEEIADRFPNLLTMELGNIQITNDGFKRLSTKCCQLKNVTLKYCNFTDEGLRCFLQALPAIKSLSISFRDYYPRSVNLLPQAKGSAVFSTCTSLEALEMGGYLQCSDTAIFSRFCKECVSLRKLVIQGSSMPSEMLARIGNCTLLTTLRLYRCYYVDDSTLNLICNGCPNLRSVFLYQLQDVTDEGLKCFATCRNLNIFETNNDKVTDETLFELSTCVNLREVTLGWCPLVSDRGCAALLAHCPRLQLLNVQGDWQQGLIGNSTVDSAIEAVECRDNGLVLEVMLRGTSVTPQIYENCHPLLRLNCIN